MATNAGGKPICSKTGLAVPECSCSRCLEAMLREFRPTLLAEEITVTHLAGPKGRRRPRAA